MMQSLIFRQSLIFLEGTIPKISTYTCLGVCVCVHLLLQIHPCKDNPGQPTRLGSTPLGNCNIFFR